MDQINLFSGDSIDSNAPKDHLGEGSATLTSPLQFHPKQLRLAPIEHYVAKRIWLDKHYLHRDYTGASLEFGVFSPDMSEIVGAIGFSQRLGGSVKGGKPNTWEIRRMWLSDERCARNSESRVLRVACRLVKKIAPHVCYIISYSDITKMQHKGTIYKAAGFSYDGLTMPADKESAGWLSHASHKVSDGYAKKRWILWLGE